MKKITTYVLGFLIATLFSGCSDWLTVYPQTEVPRNELLTDEAGFTDASTGIYIKMKDTKTYGLALTMTTLEQLVSSWDVESSSVESYIGQFDYENTSVKSRFEQIYAQQYSTIASINTILDVIDEQEQNFETDGMFEQVKGECLGLRAYIHFDLLRLFGPIPSLANGDNILPYVTHLGKEINPLITFAAFKEKLEMDMNEADNLLGIAEKYGNYNSYRSIRMNQQAVKALKARAYLWFGETTKAYTQAKMIIDSTNLVLGTSADLTNGNYSLTGEHIFGLHEMKLYDRYSNNFGNRTLKRGTSPALINTDLYGNTGTDIREANLWEVSTADNGAQGYILKKYKVSSQTPSTFSADYRRIPLVRLSEIYLIAAETAPSSSEAQIYWAAFKESRNLASVEVPEDHDTFVKEIVKEYRKEFFGEGQAFFAYKRLNVGEDDFLWLPASANINYEVPLPDTEILYN